MDSGAAGARDAFPTKCSGRIAHADYSTIHLVLVIAATSPDFGGTVDLLDQDETG